MKHWLSLLLALLAISSAQALEVSRSRGCASDDPQTAISACTQLLARPDLPAKVKAAAFFQRAMAHLAFQRRQEAVTDLTAAIENDPSLALAYLNRATILNTLGRTSEAIEDATRAIALAPTLPAAFANRSWFYQGIGRFDEAVSDGTKAIGLSPTFAQAYTNRAWANFKRRHFDAAIADYAVSTSLDERNAGALRQLGLLKFYAGDFAGSADSLAKALALDGDPYTALLLYISQARRGERSVNGLKERLATLKAGIWPFAIFELLLGTKTPDEALSAATSRDEQCEAHFYLSQKRIIESDWASARRSLDSALQLCPDTLIEREAVVADAARAPANPPRDQTGIKTLEYLSDTPGSVFAWLESEQRKRDNGSCSVITTEEYLKVLRSLPRRGEDEPEQLLRAVGFDTLKLPTRCEDLGSYFIINLRALDIRNAASRVLRKALPAIYWGTLHNTDINALVQQYGNDHIVVLNRNIFPFLYSMALTVVRTIEIKLIGQEIQYNFTDEAFERALLARPETLRDFENLIISFATAARLPDLEFANKEESDIVTLLLSGMERFIVGHEFGHVVADDTSAHIHGLIRSPSLGYDWKAELQADEQGDRLAAEARQAFESATPLFRALLTYSSALFFEFSDVLHDATMCKGTGEGAGRTIDEASQIGVVAEVQPALTGGRLVISDHTAGLLGCRQNAHPPAWLRGRMSLDRADAIMIAEPEPAPLEVRLAKALVQNARKLATRSAASIARQLSQ